MLKLRFPAQDIATRLKSRNNGGGHRLGVLARTAALCGQSLAFGEYRIRTGDYRVQFHVRGEVVEVERIGHRDAFYED